MKQVLLYALVLLAACGRPMVRPPEPELPPIPSQVVSQLGPVPVVVVDSLQNGNGQSALGGFHTIRRTIYIRRDVLENPRLAWLVLLHEQVHVFLFDSGIANLIPPDVAQAIADASAAYRVQEMLAARRSPSR